jgi:two-component system, sensor histidine kinase
MRGRKMGQPTDLSQDQRLPRLRSSWPGVVGAALALILLVAMLAQARQYAAVRHAMQASDNQAQAAVHEARVQTLQLREQWRLTASDPLAADASASHRRFEQWQAASQALRSTEVVSLLGETPAYALLRAELDQFAARAEVSLDPGASPAPPPSRDRVLALLPALQALDDPMHTLARTAADLVAHHTEQRALAIQRQSHWGLVLTVFMAALSLALAWVAARHLQKLGRQRRSLERQAQELDRARREAEQASESKSVFLANMSHEVRTPFHGLMGMLSLLRETGLTPRQLDYLRTATESADHLLAILNDILDMSQLDTGRMTISPVPLDLRGLLHEVEALMRPQANSKSLALHIETDPVVPESIVGDPTRIKQILLNLLSNAIKFSDRGAVVLDVRCGVDERGSATLLFVVTDTGMGMDEATRRLLFQRFVRGEGVQSRRHPGTGLGLEISRNLARLMQGDITASSRPGEGSTFTFSMALQVAALGTEPARARVDSAPMQPATQRLRVLVAEDHAVNRQYMAALLDNLGHQAHFTANGEEAVAAAQEQCFDLVLMDLHMPVLDGLGATRAIRALPHPTAATVPIVALTADALEQTRQRCLVAGMNDFLIKPVSPQKLASSLRRLFGSAVCPGSGGPQASGAPVAQAPNPCPVVDPATLQMALKAMPRERLAGLIDAYLNLGPHTAQRLRAAVRDAQPLELRVNAHAAKGAARNLGLSALAVTAEALHEGAAHLPAHEIARLVQRFEELLPLTREAVRAEGLEPTVGKVTR